MRDLKRADAELAGWMARVGPCRLELRPPQQPFAALLRAIVYQQLAGRAAAAIHARVLALFPPGRQPQARHFLALDEAELRQAGLSRNKQRAIASLAEHVIDRKIPRRATLARWSDEEVIDCLTQVHGVGRWTAEMLLMFNLGRPDVLPRNDLGLLNGFERAFGSNSPDELLARGELWRPWRTIASWYLWRIAELPAAKRN
ncbi:MAG: DNA-3-methyladenine glycosylase 2 family protein [Gammaproteobacteria bacterium]|nr:DNA-3-methyladenine glycosylase 2 family protein [Gammaproteobacteria bacterium]